ncbi:PAAR domain-containing protein [Paraburkholderia sp. Ac-20340]|uniref:PAAR domain-containing protein n=1 Tax=Paraburkholderia sp. Ac-20340 TaxID=2703888 RepID=UPI0019804112|nr:PAAR domain-containing protein [Paraburkholderia sp. Ac-20340]MBN3857789.1 PAAR domain-containing protein [Paraburkholderia sp. Ac-20340]
MRRRIAVVGDKLSSGGYVLNYTPLINVTFYGHLAALIGGDAYCEVCRSTGAIAKSGGPSRRNLQEREIALDGDEVRCKCASPPHIVAVFAGETWHEDGANPVTASAQRGVNPALENLQTLEFSEQFTLKDAEGRPLADVFYTLKTQTGMLIRGVTDSAGRTRRYTSDGEQVVAVYLGHREGK